MQAGGVCIIIKNVTINPVHVDKDSKYNEFHRVCIDIFSSCLPKRIVAGYTPPSSETSTEYVQYIKHLIECLTSLSNVDSSIAIVS